MVYNGEYVCSGTLISPSVFLTVAHCTQAYERADLQVRVTFESRADFDPDAAYTGTPYTHPKWDGFPDFPDVGVVVLDEAVDTGAGYGRLPEAGIVERFETGKELLTVVGYGVRGFETGGGKPEPTAGGIREKSTVEYFGTEGAANSFAAGGYYIKTLQASGGEGGEGACLGDSGGPHFLPQTSVRSWRSARSASATLASRTIAAGRATPSGSTWRSSWAGCAASSKGGQRTMAMPGVRSPSPFSCLPYSPKCVERLSGK